MLSFQNISISQSWILVFFVLTTLRMCGFVTTMNGSERKPLIRWARRTGSSDCRYCADRWRECAHWAFLRIQKSLRLSRSRTECGQWRAAPPLLVELNLFSPRYECRDRGNIAQLFRDATELCFRCSRPKGERSRRWLSKRQHLCVEPKKTAWKRG